MQYSILIQTRPVWDISAGPTDPAIAATPAPEFVHAVRVDDDQLMCDYERKAADVRDLARDWTTVQLGEQPCEMCIQAVKLAA
jgi:hypothetical protein